jgi:hypothetical protein
VAESDYAAARTQLEAARGAGGLDPDETAELYRLSGFVDAAFGDVQAATDDFTRLLAVAPRTKLPAGTSPKFRRPFDAAAAYFASHAPLEVKIETDAATPSITLIVASDPLAMIARAHVAFTVNGGAEQIQDVAAAPGASRIEVALPPGKRIDARIAALDDHGNELIDIGSKLVPVVILGQDRPRPAVVVTPPLARPPIRTAAPAPPVYRRWWPYAAAAVGFGGVAGGFGLAARSATSELDRITADSIHHSFTEARAVEDRARRDLVLANVGLAFAGAFAVTSGVLYLLAPREPAEHRVVAVPVAGGAAVVWAGGF